jgi:hypothetical protein
MAAFHPIPRHANFQNLTGKKYSRLTVLGFGGKKLGRSTWVCRCDCGKQTTVYAQHLKESITTSCGCWMRELCIARSTTHGLARTPEHIAWMRMKIRCYNKNTKDYPDYGGRGITVCDRWLNSFEAFLADMGLKPSSKHSLDRYPDNNGNYEPGNCRWATAKEQTRNARSNRLVTFNGRQMCIGELAELVGMDYFLLRGRILHRRWSVEKAVSTPVKKRA